MDPAKIVRMSARYDTTESAAQRGWIVDLELEGGVFLTVPAAPPVFFAAREIEPAFVEKATGEYLVRKQKSARALPFTSIS